MVWYFWFGTLANRISLLVEHPDSRETSLNKPKGRSAASETQVRGPSPTRSFSFFTFSFFCFAIFRCILEHKLKEGKRTCGATLDSNFGSCSTPHGRTKKGGEEQVATACETSNITLMSL